MLALCIWSAVYQSSTIIVGVYRTIWFIIISLETAETSDDSACEKTTAESVQSVILGADVIFLLLKQVCFYMALTCLLSLEKLIGFPTVHFVHPRAQAAAFARKQTALFFYFNSFIFCISFFLGTCSASVDESKSILTQITLKLMLVQHNTCYFSRWTIVCLEIGYIWSMALMSAFLKIWC